MATGLALEGAEALLKLASWLLPGPAGKLAGWAEEALDEGANLWAKVSPYLQSGKPVPPEHAAAAIDLVTRLNLQDQTGPSE